MAIIFHEKTGVFHLYNQEISYIFCILRNQQLGHIYYGKKVRDREDFRHLIEYARRDMAPCAYEGDPRFSLEHIKQEYPSYGSGDMRYGAFSIENKKGSKVVDFRYKSHQIYSGKKPLEGLPATYMEQENEGQTLEIVLEDTYLQTEITLSYTIYETFPVITKSAFYRCNHQDGITLHHSMSGCLDLPDKEYEMMALAGAWSREREVHKRELTYGIQGIYSLRGCSSHQHNPFLALQRKDTTEFQGETIGFSLVYSGDFLMQVEVDTCDVTRVIAGIHPNEFEWEMKEGESFQTPELVMAYSDKGRNYLSQVFHKLYRTRLARGIWKEKERPILLNNWEATYFDFHEERILDIAKRAKEVGVELFVLDDGWFGKRNTDTCSLGDWYPNLSKLPSGITGLSQKIEELGMKFGLWIEPEMISKDSDLFRQHPDWILADQERNYCHSRNQYILDYSKEEVVECIYQQLDTVLSKAKISYIKWDMNRSFSEVFSNGNSKSYQGKVRHKYILGVYSLYERLIKKYPHILFESCASGGARFDPGMLYYAPQTWTSDNTDAIARLKIQYGTSFVYPISSIGSHVSASPNHQVFRDTPMETRANVAYFGTFGYELDITKCTDIELEQMKHHIEFMKRYRKLIQQGVFYRLQSPFEGNVTAWMVVSEDKKEALLGYYRVLQPSHAKLERIYAKGLLEDECYEVKECFGGQIDLGEKYGDECMNIGISTSDFSCCLPDMMAQWQGDYFSRLFHFKAK